MKRVQPTSTLPIILVSKTGKTQTQIHTAGCESTSTLHLLHLWSEAKVPSPTALNPSANSAASKEEPNRQCPRTDEKLILQKEIQTPASSTGAVPVWAAYGVELA